MAGGITDLASFTAGTPLDVVSKGASLFSGAGLLSAGNPYMAGAQVLMSLMSTPDISAGFTGGQALSGQADFTNNDTIAKQSKLIDLATPKGIAIAAGLVVLAIYAIKKFRG